MTGYCAAARAALYLRLKDKQSHRAVNLTWDGFCPAVLNLSRSEVDKQIALLNEFGPRFFALAAIAPVSPETYRLIEPSLADNTLKFDGQSIPLDREHAPEVASAVTELRRRAKAAKPAPPPPTVFDDIKQLGIRAQILLEDCHALSSLIQGGDGWLEFLELLNGTVAGLTTLQKENGL